MERRRPDAAQQRFRRGLYVMLIALGLLAAASLLYARQAQEQARRANADAAAVRRGQAIAQQQRAQIDVQVEALRLMLIDALRNSSDPRLRAWADLQR